VKASSLLFILLLLSFQVVGNGNKVLIVSEQGNGNVGTERSEAKHNISREYIEETVIEREKGGRALEHGDRCHLEPSLPVCGSI